MGGLRKDEEEAGAENEAADEDAGAMNEGGDEGGVDANGNASTRASDAREVEQSAG
jgi:hypothetical protein